MFLFFFSLFLLPISFQLSINSIQFVVFLSSFFFLSYYDALCPKMYVLSHQKRCFKNGSKS